MATKSKPVMETVEGEVKSTRPTRNLKPVSYKEVKETGKRSPTADKAAKESEPKDKKKKKVNGSSNVDEPTKKSGKKKAADPIDEPNEQNGDDNDELMPESRNQPDGPKSVAEKVTKKAQPRKKKADEDSDVANADDNDDKKTQNGSKAPIRRKGKDATAQTNDENSSESAKVPSKPAKGKKATTAEVGVKTDAVEETSNGEKVALKPAKGKKATPAAAKVKADSQDSGDDAATESVASKPVATKTSRSKKGNAMEASGDNQDKPVSSKNTRGKKADKEEPNGKNDSQDESPTQSKPAKSAKGKKAVPKESNDAVEDNENTETSGKAASKGRSKKPTAKDQATVQPTTRRGTKRKAAEPFATGRLTSRQAILRGTKRKSEDPVQNTVSQPKVTKTASTTESPITVIDLQSPQAEWNIKITTWNVAGLRAAVKKNGIEYLTAENSDIICLQETKCTADQIPPEINDIKGYHKYWRGEKGGKAGVSLFTKVMPYEVKFGLDDAESDSEARVITAEYTKFYLICVYVPNSGRKLVNLEKRLAWDAKFQDYLESLNKKMPVIICGDMNVAHEEIDLANPKTNKRSAGFTVEERNSFTNLLNKGFVDTYRQLYPDQLKAFTFWTYLNNARKKNIGWRLDYFIVSSRIMCNVVDNIIRSAILGSDHCPVSLFLKL